MLENTDSYGYTNVPGYVFHLNDYITVDNKKLLEEHSSAIFKDFTSTKQRGNYFDRVPAWRRCNIPQNHGSVDVFPELARIHKILCEATGSDMTPNWFIQSPGMELPWHIDDTPTCGANLLLEPGEPIIFKNGESVVEIKYKFAILDIKRKHMVASCDKPRKFVKWAGFDISYDDCVRNTQKYFGLK